MRLAYADPPYLGMGKRLYGAHHPDAALWDDPQTHRDLVARLVQDYPDGWAISCNPKDLAVYLPECPPRTRVGSWMKPGLPNVPFTWSRIAFCWEPLIFYTTVPTRRHASDSVARDVLGAMHNAGALRDKVSGQPLIGSKPVEFCRWVLDLLGYTNDDTLDDLFPGSGVMAHAIAAEPLSFEEPA